MRGELRRIAISPKNWPRVRVASVRSCPSSSRMISTSPSMMMKNLSAGAPCLTITAPGSISTVFSCAASVEASRSGRSRKTL
jgi:hypothetical protein